MNVVAKQSEVVVGCSVQVVSRRTQKGACGDHVLHVVRELLDAGSGGEVVASLSSTTMPVSVSLLLSPFTKLTIFHRNIIATTVMSF